MHCSFKCDCEVFISNNRGYRCIKCNRAFNHKSFTYKELPLTNDKEISEFIDKLYAID